jgi:hypothetical protein
MCTHVSIKSFNYGMIQIIMAREEYKVPQRATAEIAPNNPPAPSARDRFKKNIKKGVTPLAIAGAIAKILSSAGEPQVVNLQDAANPESAQTVNPQDTSIGRVNVYLKDPGNVAHNEDPNKPDLGDPEERAAKLEKLHEGINKLAGAINQAKNDADSKNVAGGWNVTQTEPVKQQAGQKESEDSLRTARGIPVEHIKPEENR